MKNLKLNLCAGALFAVFAQGAAAQSAGDFDAMWYSSAGGTIKGSNGVGVYGPTLIMHAPNRVYQVASFTPPKFSAGCSGIDMMFGSFTMISSKQIEQLVRNIMTAAPGYLLQLAIKAMCEDCSSIMQSIQHIAHMINSGQINACRVAQAAVNSAANDFGVADNSDNKKETVESLASSAEGKFSDAWGAMNNLFAGGSKANRQANDQNSTGYGNTFINTFYNAGAQNKIDFAVFGGEQQGLQIMMSILGTDIIPTAQNISDNNGSPDANHTLNDNAFPSLLHFQNLVQGTSGNQPQYYVCGTFNSGDPMTCQDLSQAQPFTYPGLRPYLITLFAGPQDPTAANGPDGVQIQAIQPGSIIDSLQKGVPLTAAQAGAMKMLPMDLQKMAIDMSQMNDFDQIAIYNYAFDLFAETLAASIAYAMVNAINYAYTYQGSGAAGASKTTIKLKPDQMMALRELESVAQAKASIQTRLDRLQKLRDMITKAGENNTRAATASH